jgi:hypothetical protein
MNQCINPQEPIVQEHLRILRHGQQPRRRPWLQLLEHCAGFSWALYEGLFGISLFSDREAAATIHDPLARMDPAWTSAATARFVLRGTNVSLSVTPSTRQLVLSGEGAQQTVRLLRKGARAKLVCVGTGCPPAESGEKQTGV